MTIEQKIEAKYGLKSGHGSELFYGAQRKARQRRLGRNDVHELINDIDNYPADMDSPQFYAFTGMTRSNVEFIGSDTWNRYPAVDALGKPITCGSWVSYTRA